MTEIREFLENTLKEEVLKVTGGINFQHNVTHEGIMSAMQKAFDAGLKKGETLEKIKQKKEKALAQRYEQLGWSQLENS